MTTPSITLTIPLSGLAIQIENSTHTADVSLASRGSSILAVVGIFTTLSIALVIARVFVRARVQKAFGFDDGMMILSGVCIPTLQVIHLY